MADFYQCLNSNCTNINLSYSCANRRVVREISPCKELSAAITWDTATCWGCSQAQEWAECAGSTPEHLESKKCLNEILFLLCWFFFARYLCVRGRSPYLSFCLMFIKLVCQCLHRGALMLLGEAGNLRFKVAIWEAGGQPVQRMA